jgi:hypothetical protein
VEDTLVDFLLEIYKFHPFRQRAFVRPSFGIDIVGGRNTGEGVRTIHTERTWGWVFGTGVDVDLEMARDSGGLCETVR